MSKTKDADSVSPRRGPGLVPQVVFVSARGIAVSLATFSTFLLTDVASALPTGDDPVNQKLEELLNKRTQKEEEAKKKEAEKRQEEAEIKKEAHAQKPLEHWCCKNKHEGKKGEICKEALNINAEESSLSDKPSTGLCEAPINQKCPTEDKPKVKPGVDPKPPAPPVPPAPAPPGGGGGGGGGGGNPLGGMMQALPQLLGALAQGGQQGQQGQQPEQSSDAGQSSDAEIIEMALAAQTAAAQATAVAQATAIAQATAQVQATAIAQATAEAQANAIAQATDAPEQSVYVPISGWDETTSEDSAVSAGGGSSQIEGAATPRSGLAPDSKF